MDILCEDADKEFLINMRDDLLAKNFMDFHRRVCQQLRGYPERLLWILEALPSSKSSIRNQIAGEMLGLEQPAAPLDINAQKLARQHRWDLQECYKNDGVIAFTLWSKLWMVSKGAKPQTAEAEAANSFVKRQGTLSPNISLELLSSRLT